MRAPRIVAALVGLAMAGAGTLAAALPAQAATPASVTDVAATSTGDCRVHLSWSTPGGPADLYTLRANGVNGSSTGQSFTTEGDLDVPQGQVTLSVTPYNYSGGPGDSTTIDFNVPVGSASPCLPPTAKPQDVATQWTDDDHLKVTWSAAVPSAGEPSVNGSYRVCLTVQSGARSNCVGAVYDTTWIFSTADYDPAADPMTITVGARNALGVDETGVSVQVPLRPSSVTDGDVACAGGGTYHVQAGMVTGNSGCSGAVVFGSGVTVIGYGAFRGSGVTSAVIGDSVTTIAGEAFNEASQLAAVSIGNSVTIVGWCSFQGTALRSVVLGDSVTSIEAFAFRRIPTLTSFTFGAAFPADGLGSNVFEYANISSFNVNPANTHIYASDGVIFSADGTRLVLFPLARTGSYTVPSSVTSLPASAFAGSHLSHVELNSSITTLPDYVFYGSALESIDLTNITSVGNYAFQGAHLASLTIPRSMTSVGSFAFSGNPITTLTIPSTLTSIGGFAFSELGTLRALTIEEGVTFLSYGMFRGVGVERVSLPSTITVIPGETFNEASRLSQVRFGSSVTIVGWCSFQGTALTSVVLGKNVTSIEACAFHRIPTLTSVSLPDGIQSIGDQAFTSSGVSTIVYCGSDPAILTSSALPVTPQCIHVPDAPTVTGGTSTDGTSVALSVTPPSVSPDSPITSYTARSTPGDIETTGELVDGTLTVTGLTPDTDYTFSVTANNIAGPSIASATSSVVRTAQDVACPGGGTYHVTAGVVDSTSNCEGELVIADGITSIGPLAFLGSRLTSLVLPDSVTQLGTFAFAGSQRLQSVTLGSGLTDTGDRTFTGDSALASVTFRGAVTRIGASSFGGTHLGSFVVPSTVRTIASQAFTSSGLTSISLPDGLVTLGDSAFESNPDLTSLSFGSGLRDLGTNVIGGTGVTTITVASSNPHLTLADGLILSKDGTSIKLFPPTRTGSYAIPDSVTSLNDGAFQNSRLTSVVIGSGLTVIPDNAFSGSALTAITIPSSITSIGSQAFMSTHLTSVVIPDSVTTLGMRAFSGIQTLRSATLGTGITNTGDMTFMGDSALTSVTFRGSLTRIGSDTFGATNLGRFIVPSSVTTIGSQAFISSGLTSIALPAGLTALGINAFASTQLTAIVYCGDPSVLEGQSLPVTPTCVHAPDAPTIATAAAVNDTTIDLTITPPAGDGGSSVIDYTAISSPGDVEVTGTLTDGVLRVAGLAAGTNYTFTVTANNLAGPSVASTSSPSISTLQPALAPQMGNPTSTTDGFTASIRNFNASWLWAAEATNGGEAAIDDFGILTVTNLEPGEASTVTVTSTRPGYANGSSDINGQALQAGLTPAFSAPIPSGTGFVVQISNFDANFQWSAYSDIGQAVVDDSGLVTVTGLSIGEQANVTITTSRYSYADASSQVTGSRRYAARTPDLTAAVASSAGFSFQISNYDAAWSWFGDATNGGVASVSDSGLVTVTGISSGASSTVTITSRRDQYQDGTAVVTGMRLNVARTPLLGTPVATASGFTVQITNFDSHWEWRASASNGGTASVSNTGLVTVTGIAVGESSTVTVRSIRTNYVTGTADASATRLRAARTPSFEMPISNDEGFTVQIGNYDTDWRWAATATNGGVVSISNSGLITVTGLRAGASSDVTITTVRSGYVTGAATVTGSRLRAALNPTFGAVRATQAGFTVQISNFDDAYDWVGTATNAGVVSISTTGLVTVTGMAEGASSKATISSSRRGFSSGKASVTGTRLSAALTPLFGPITQTTDGFKAQITNYVAEFTWTATATAGATVKVSSTGLVTVSGLAKTAPSTATVKATRVGYVTGTATFASAALPGLSQMTPEQIAMLTAKDVAAYPTTVWSSVGASQMRAFTPAAIAGLTAAVFKALKTGLLGALTVQQVPSLSLDCIKSATRAIIGDMTGSALVGLTVEQIKVLAPKAALAVPGSAYSKMTLLQRQALDMVRSA